jgi:hypothetical protein
MRARSRHHRARLLRAGVVLLLAVASTSCAALRRGMSGAGEEPPVDPDAITVDVRNNVSPPTGITVYVLTDAGTRYRLGTVTGSSTERFVVDVPPVGRIRFYARTSEGREIASNPVSLRPSQMLEWDLFSNVVSERYGRALTPPGASARGR